MIRSTLIVCALAFSGVVFSQSQAARIKAFDVTKTKERVADEFSDPDSVKFRRLFISEFVNSKGEAHLSLCGEVNAKNKMGGYVGYRKFMANEKSALVEPGADEDGMASVRRQMIELAYPKSCGNNVKELK